MEVDDIIIVGAGTAGMAAGRFIERYNELNLPSDKVTYRILEATGNPSVQGLTPAVPPLMGRSVAAHDIAGAEGNPIYELKHIQETIRGGPETPEWQIKWEDIKHFECEGTYGSIESCSVPSKKSIKNARNDFREVYKCVREDFEFDSKCSLGDALECSLGDALDQCYDGDWLGNGDKSRIWYEYDFEYAEDPRSTVYDIFEPTYTTTGQEKDIYISHGADGIIRKEYQFYGIDRCVCSGAKVTDISFDETCTENCAFSIETETETKTGTETKTYQAKQVIITTSVGVLVRKGIDMGIFSGADDKYEAMKRLYFSPSDVVETSRGDPGSEHMPLYYTIAFQFDDSRAIWNNDYAL
mmetsp:Transcript_17347/g.37452  ORF Transcript_17347/g.37452 Transcript_17347/m.37452 type:complete len:355 (-) Transcript_17347:948-2012(-)